MSLPKHWVENIQHYGGALSASRRVLSVDDTESHRTGSQLSTGGVIIQCVKFGPSLEQTLDDFDPDTVVAPLFADSFDCIDVARALQTAEFSGTYYVLYDSVADPSAIRTEIETVCPLLEVELVRFD